MEHKLPTSKVYLTVITNDYRHAQEDMITLKKNVVVIQETLIESDLQFVIMNDLKGHGSEI